MRINGKSDREEKKIACLHSESSDYGPGGEQAISRFLHFL